MSTITKSTFHEVQRLNQWWIWAVVGPITLLMWWGFIQQIFLGIPFGTNPGPDWLIWLVWVAFGLILPTALAFCQMRTHVDENGLQITYIPFFQRTIPFGQISECEAVTYKPILHYGGWGIRWSPGKGSAYNVSGNQGVQLVLQDEKKLLIGSQKAEELAEAINSHLG